MKELSTITEPYLAVPAKRDYTPGPWRIRHGVSPRVYLIDGPDGAVGEIVYCDTRKAGDARLISAAPQLLAALERCVDQIEQMRGLFDDSDGAIQAALDDARTAIDAAIGAKKR